MPRILTLPRKLTCGNCTFAVFALCAATAITVSAQTLTTLHSFDGTDGQYPEGALVQAANGHLYGATEEGGANSDGTLFNVTRPGALTSLYSFCSQSNCSDGAFPGYMTLVGATNGDVYGTTINGGFGVGTVFKMTLSGAITTLYSFCSVSNCADGITPYAGLVQATNSDLYGTTEAGGANGGGGTVFKITPKGTLTTLYSFCAQSGCADGSSPWAGLVQATNGDLYGTTTAGGANGGGTVFKITPSGAFTTLYSFCALSNCTDGKLPYGGLIEASNGDLYGTTGEGGTSLYYGTIFKITLGGTLTTLYNFCSQSGCADGASPTATLILGNDGNLYGTAYTGGAAGNGTIFQVTPAGALTVLYAFCVTGTCSDGAIPYAGLVQDTDGTFYGTTHSGGTNDACLGNCGTVYSLSTGLGPFVKTIPTASKVGTVVRILGTNLTEATTVRFNGTAAVFTIVSSTEITATVPSGASTGKVSVVTPSGKLLSNIRFRVLP